MRGFFLKKLQTTNDMEEKINPIKILPQHLLIVEDFEVSYDEKFDKKDKCMFYAVLNILEDAKENVNYPFSDTVIRPLMIETKINKSDVIETLRGFDVLYSDFYEREYTFQEVINDHQELFTSEVLANIAHEHIKRNEFELRAMSYRQKVLEQQAEWYKTLNTEFKGLTKKVIENDDVLKAVKYGFQRASAELLYLSSKLICSNIPKIPFNKNRTSATALEKVA